MTARELQLLEEGIATLGLRLDDSQVRSLQRYAAEIELWNPRLGLVHAAGSELICKHFLDSLAAVPYIEGLIGSHETAAADLGSGNGFPGVVLAIALPQLRITLVERSGKRCGFLRNVAALLPEVSLTVQQQDLSGVAGSYQLLVSRAFRPLQPAIVEQMQRITADNGSWVLYKGDHDTARQELDSAGLAASIVPLEVPGVEGKRCLAVCRFGQQG